MLIKRFSFSHALIISCLASFLLIALYWPGLQGPFLLDDLPSLEHAKLESFSLKKLSEVSFSNDTGPLGRPLTIATFALNDYLLGQSPLAYKAVNLGIHIITFFAVLFFIYLLTTFTPAKKYRVQISFFTAIFWAFHPLLLSTVLYSVQRMTELSCLFVLLGLNTYLYARLRQLLNKPYTIPLFAASFGILFPLAVLSKEIGILFPWYLLAIEYFILRFRCKERKNVENLRRFHSILSLSLLLGALVYYWINLHQYLGLFAEKGITLFDRLLTQTKALIFYLQLITLPDITKMSLYHDDFPIATTLTLGVSLSLLTLAALIVFIFAFPKKLNVVKFGLAWFFISQSIESTAIPLEMVFEHRTYISVIGILFIPFYYIVPYFKILKKHSKYFVGISTLILFGFFCELTFSRALVWSSMEKFLSFEAYYHPRSPRTHIELANWFLNKQDYPRAFFELEIAQALEPLNAGISLHKVLILCRAQSIPNALYADAKRRIQNGRINPYLILVLDTMVQNMFLKQCNSVNKDKIIEIIQTGLKNPFLAYKPQYIATLYHLQGGIHVLQKNIPQSLVDLSNAYKANPKHIDALIQKAYLELQHAKYQEAKLTIEQIQKSKRQLRYPSGKVQKLMNDYQKIIKLKDEEI